jgi:uncharacterized membrane protein
MMILMAVCSLVVLILLGALVYLGVRALTSNRYAPGHSAQAVLDRRLAAGELSPEEYFELDSALRSTEGSR